MQCSKCYGQMAREQFVGKIYAGSMWSYDGWRCIQCGAIVDEVILANQTKIARTRALQHRRRESVAVARR